MTPVPDLTRHEIEREFLAAGWRVKQGKSTHRKVYCPCGKHMVVISPLHGNRARENFMAQTRRTRCPFLPAFIRRECDETGTVR